MTATTGAKGITVKWALPANGGSPITAVRIYRAITSGAERFLVSVSPGTTSYVDKNLAKKTKYYYWVRAVNVLGEGVLSAEVSATSR